MPEMMLQQRGFFDDPAIVAVSVLRQFLAADEEPIGSFFF